MLDSDTRRNGELLTFSITLIFHKMPLFTITLSIVVLSYSTKNNLSAVMLRHSE